MYVSVWSTFVLGAYFHASPLNSRHLCACQRMRAAYSIVRVSTLETLGSCAFVMWHRVALLSQRPSRIFLATSGSVSLAQAFDFSATFIQSVVFGIQGPARACPAYKSSDNPAWQAMPSCAAFQLDFDISQPHL